jgi:hypothetical protein
MATGAVVDVVERTRRELRARNRERQREALTAIISSDGDVATGSAISGSAPRAPELGCRLARSC